MVPGGPNTIAPDIRLTEDRTEQVVRAIGEAWEGNVLTVEELSEEVVARTGPWAGDLVMPAFRELWPRRRQVLHRAGNVPCRPTVSGN